MLDSRLAQCETCGMKILAIETSADETAAAVVENGSKLLSSAIASSIDLTTAYGGIVPEIAARSHLEVITPVIDQALTDAFGAKSQELRAKSQKVKKISTINSGAPAEFDLWSQIDAIAVTVGPGLGGSLLIGLLAARTLAIAKNKPLYAVNHVQAHIYANFLTEKANSSTLTAISLGNKQPQFPILALIVSGGHTQLVLMKSHQDYKLLGQTADDAVGEAFDKVAKMLGLPYPGGPSVAKVAQAGDPKAYKLPKAKMGSPYDFSFSGLKTAVLRAAQTTVGKDFTLPSSALPELLNDAQKANLAASFQQTAIDTLVGATQLAERQYHPKTIVVGGGVAANSQLQDQLTKKLESTPVFPDIKLCTDNAVMIASLAYFMRKTGQPTADPYRLPIEPSLSM